MESGYRREKTEDRIQNTEGRSERSACWRAPLSDERGNRSVRRPRPSSVFCLLSSVFFLFFQNRNVRLLESSKVNRMTFKQGFALLSLLVYAVAAPAQTLPSGVQKITSVEGITEYALPNGLH